MLLHHSFKLVAMSNQIVIQIPEPCHEDWDKMLPTQQGRYCESCCKTVVDFELLSDQEVLNYFAKNTGKVCGRFNTQQLNRPLEVTTKIPHKKGWKWTIASITSLVMVACRNFGEKVVSKKANTEQTVRVLETTTVGVLVVDNNEVESNISHTNSKSSNPQYVETTTKGEVSIPVQEPVEVKELVEGKLEEPLIERYYRNAFMRIYVTDSAGNALENALVQVLNAKPSAQLYSDKNGIITIDENLLKHNNKLQLSISLVGYESKLQEVQFLEADTTLKVELQEKASSLSDVVIIASSSSRTMGAVVGGGVYRVVCKKVTKTDLAKQQIKNTFSGKSFTAFPNPATKGSLVTLSFKTVGDFTVNLIDNNGRFYFTQSINVNTAKEDFKIELPSTLSSGIYYLVAINQQSKKQEIEKIVVQ